MPATRTGPDPGLVIAQVTPFAWEVANEVNEYVARVSDRLSARGHRVLIIAPSQSEELVGSSRKLIRSDPEELDRKSTRLNSSHERRSRMPSSA